MVVKLNTHNDRENDMNGVESAIKHSCLTGFLLLSKTEESFGPMRKDKRVNQREKLTSNNGINRSISCDSCDIKKTLDRLKNWTQKRQQFFEVNYGEWTSNILMELVPWVSSRSD